MGDPPATVAGLRIHRLSEHGAGRGLVVGVAEVLDDDTGTSVAQDRVGVTDIAARDDRQARRKVLADLGRRGRDQRRLRVAEADREVRGGEVGADLEGRRS